MYLKKIGNELYIKEGYQYAEAIYIERGSFEFEDIYFSENIGEYNVFSRFYLSVPSWIS